MISKTKPMGILDGKVAVITGSTRGFGLAMARSFLEAGAQVVVSSRAHAAVESALAGLHQPSRAAGLPCDVGRLEDVEALAAFALSRFNKLDIWINNAGIAGPYGPTLGLAPQTFTSVVQTNILGTYHGSLVALRHFADQKHGKLINILGHGYKGPVPFQSAYSASKIWMRSFTQSLIVENKGSGISIFAYNPGMMDTELLTNIDVVSGYEEKLKVFPTVVRILARPPHFPAQEVVNLASCATDGQPGKVISINSGPSMLLSAFKELSRRFSGKPALDKVKIRSLPFGKA
jgi:glucose 1-dehydrogenase